VHGRERDKLLRSLRAGQPDTQLQEQLSQVNEAVSRRDETVSPGCYTASLHATGAGSGRPFLTDEQQWDFIRPEVAEMLKRTGVRLVPKMGPDGRPMPIRERGFASARTGASPEYFREQLKLRPDSTEVWNNYGAFLWGRRQPEKAIEAFQKAIELDRSNATALANLANKLWLHSGDAAEADRLYARAVEAAEPSVPASILSDFAALCDEGLSEPDRAAQLHERAAQDENYPLARARYALFILKYRNDPDGANALLARALEKQPDNPQILFMAAQADWFYNKNPEAARRRLHKACSLDSNDVQILGMTAYVSMGLGDSASAAYYYRKLIKRGQSDAQAHNDYVLALLMGRKPDGALRHLAQAMRAAPDDRIVPMIRANRAAALWALRRHDEAIELMRAILNDTPPPQLELEVLAMLHVAAPSSANDTDQRMHQLIESGVRSDGNTVRSIARDKPRTERDAGYQLASMIEDALAI